MSAFYPLLNGQRFPHPLGKIVCVGRNYAAHAAELNNPVLASPLLFIKPATAATPLSEPVRLPQHRGAVHHELELAVLIGAPLTDATPAEAAAAIIGLGVALDLTLREVQDQLKHDGHPWERAKAFDGSYPVSAFIAPQGRCPQNLTIQLWRNGQLQQDGHTGDMLFKVLPLIVEMSQWFSLQPGDIVSTGTPAGVGPLVSGDQLVATLGAGDKELIRVETQVA